MSAAVAVAALVAKTTSAATLAAECEDANMMEDTKWTLPAHIKTEAEIKSKAILDSASQPVLGGTGDHWKCNQCKVVFETGPELLDHLEQMRQSEHKCTSCHVIFDDRKMLLLHRRRFHPTAVKIKSEPTTTSSGTSSSSEQGRDSPIFKNYS
jgi:hypothetical protein